MLGSVTGTIPADELEGHLQRVAELYLEAGDRARADEIVRYARSRMGEAAMKRPIWAALRRGVRFTPPAGPAASAGPDGDLTAAQAALDAARLVTAAPAAPKKKGATP